ncbi:hypothetical protein KFK09_012200 [Dendrobium nobile]|uniref:Uncharacterized protein n=1 Tax=Dendrobium nobile TaxID=94219 RepID=A0A8T3BH12_DENNO|nr:hypothetical protein KFK09_012200 [Dendrobium nobile]
MKKAMGKTILGANKRKTRCRQERDLTDPLDSPLGCLFIRSLPFLIHFILLPPFSLLPSPLSLSTRSRDWPSTRTFSHSRYRLSLRKTLSVLEIGPRCGRFSLLTKSALDEEKVSNFKARMNSDDEDL